MPKLNVKQFVSLMDGAQDEDTMILICANGEEIASGTLREALTGIEDFGLNTNLMVKSFMFSGTYLTLECEFCKD